MTRCLAVPAATVLVLVTALALVAPLPAGAKSFGPGDLRLCNATRCVPIVRGDVLPRIGSFYYSGPPPAHLARPALGAPYYELRFRNGYVTGIVAAARLNRFLSYGVHLERFDAGTWYAVPRPLAQELRRLAAGLGPYRLTRAALAASR